MSAKAVHSFEEIQIGDTLGPQPLFISRKQSLAYCDAAGLAGVPRFTDDDGARKEGLPGMIIPGNMSAALIGKMVTDWATPGRGELTRIGTTYRSPVRPDMQLTLQGFITNADPEQRTAELDMWIENEDGDKQVTATATVKFPPQS